MEYTYQETSDLMDKDYEPNEEEIVQLDTIADLTTKNDIDYHVLMEFGRNNKNLFPNSPEISYT